MHREVMRCCDQETRVPSSAATSRGSYVGQQTQTPAYQQQQMMQAQQQQQQQQQLLMQQQVRRCAQRRSRVC
jgi:hypothetical protein